MAVQPALSEVLSSSPLAVMERHAETCLDCVTKLISYFEAEGVTVTYPELSPFRDAMQPLYTEFEEQVGQPVVKQLAAM